MDSRWIRHTKDTEGRTKVKEAIKNSVYALEILKTILNKELVEVQSTSKEDYNIPNWSQFQADRNGYERALKSFIALLEIQE